MLRHLEVHVGYRLATPYAVQGYGPFGSLVDEQVERGADGWPLVPASSWRGRVRAHLESLLRGLGVPVCYPPNPAYTCPHHEITLTRLFPHDRRFCPVCELFGSPWFPSRVRFSDLTHPHSPSEPAPIAERVNVAISRLLGSAEEQRLFSYETAGGGPNAGRLLQGVVVADIDEPQAGLLLLALRLPTHLGGKKARGLGLIQEVTFHIFTRSTDGSRALETVDLKSMEEWIDQALEEVTQLAVPRSV